jgi:hypothetical protein
MSQEPIPNRDEIATALDPPTEEAEARIERRGAARVSGWRNDAHPGPDRTTLQSDDRRSWVAAQTGTYACARGPQAIWASGSSRLILAVI